MFSDLEKSRVDDKLLNFHCPICGNTTILLNEQPTHVIGFPETNKIDFTKVNYVTCVMGHCTKCGYVFQFRADVLLK